MWGRKNKPKPSKKLSDLTNGLNQSTLHLAAECGNIEVARELIALGNDINAVTPLTNRTPLAEAVCRGHVTMAKLLLEAGADPNAGGISLLDEAVRMCNAPMAELLQRHGAQGEEDPGSLHIDPAVLERVRHAMMDEGKNILDVADELNRDGTPPIQGDGPWDYVLVMTALGLAQQQAEASAPPRVQAGGTLRLVMEEGETCLEITDAAYGLVYREDEPDLLEFCGETISVAAEVPRGPITAAAAEGDFSKLAGAVLTLREYSSCSDDPYLLLSGGQKGKITGGTMTILEVRTLTPGLGRHDAEGELTAEVELHVEAPEGIQMYHGRLELAFQSAG